MKVLTRIITILLIVGTFISCGEPVGNIYAGGGETNFLLIHPYRWLYITDQWFIPKDDIQIICVGNGLLREIAVDTPGVEIQLIHHAHDADILPLQPVTIIDEYQLKIPGRHEVKVTYLDMVGRYTLEVRGNYTDAGDEADVFKWVWL